MEFLDTALAQDTLWPKALLETIKLHGDVVIEVIEEEARIISHTCYSLN